MRFGKNFIGSTKNYAILLGLYPELFPEVRAP